MTGNFREKLDEVFHRRGVRTVYGFVKFGTLACVTCFGLKCFVEYHISTQYTIPTQIIERDRGGEIILQVGNLTNETTKSTVWYKSFWKPSKLEPQKLLKSLEVATPLKRKRLIERMANYSRWDVAECQTIAQRLTHSQQVALARYSTTDLRLFLPPPQLPEITDQYKIGGMLRHVLKRLPKSDKCLQYFTADALNHSEEYHTKNAKINNRWVYDFHDEDFLSSLSTLKHVEGLCLRALCKHSAIKEHCRVMVDEGILAILQYVIEIYPTDKDILHSVFRILADICVHPELRLKVAESGWVTILARYYRTNNIRVSQEVARALLNLDPECDSTYENGTFQLYPHHPVDESRIKADVVFIHGVLGGAFHTWRQSDAVCESNRTSCWPLSWLAEDLPDFRIVSIEYETSLTEWTHVVPLETEKRTIEYRGQDMLDKLVKAGVGRRPIVFVTHSMGGLLAKQMLSFAEKSAPQVCDNTRGIVFMATPHRGNHFASYSKNLSLLVQPSVEVKEMQGASNSKLEGLNAYIQGKWDSGDLKVLSFSERNPIWPIPFGYGSKKLVVVPPDDADPGYGEMVPLDCNHFDICKPRDRESDVYVHLVEFIRENVYWKRKRRKREDNDVDNDDGEFESYFDDFVML